MKDYTKTFFIKTTALSIWTLLSIMIIKWDISVYGRFHGPKIWEYAMLMIIFSGMIIVPSLAEYYLMNKNKGE